MWLTHIFYIFFFQAEDGIRDGHVTGVQTCALPIYLQAAVPEDDDQCAHKEDPHPGPEELGEYNLSAGCYIQVFDSLAVALHLIFFPYECMHKPNVTECSLFHYFHSFHNNIYFFLMVSDILVDTTACLGSHH